jgi:hypothetical protein
VLVAGLHWLGRDPVLVGDVALLDLRVKDVTAGHLPLVGFYSRFGWNHPGPVLFYVLAPFHALAGGAPWGIILGVLTWSLAAVVMTALLARSRGGLSLVALCLAAQLSVWISVGGRAVVEPWTPEVAVTLLVPFLLAMWGLAGGDGFAAVAGGIIGTALVQIHVGYALIFGAVAVAAALMMLRRRGGRRIHTRPFARHLVAAAGRTLMIAG